MDNGHCDNVERGMDNVEWIMWNDNGECDLLNFPNKKRILI